MPLFEEKSKTYALLTTLVIACVFHQNYDHKNNIRFYVNLFGRPKFLE